MCVCGFECLFASVLEGKCQGTPLLSWASLRAMLRARNQETTSREVCGNVSMCLYILLYDFKNRFGSKDVFKQLLLSADSSQHDAAAAHVYDIASCFT